MKKTLLYATMLALLLPILGCSNQAVPSGSKASQGDGVNLTNDADHFPAQQ